MRPLLTLTAILAIVSPAVADPPARLKTEMPGVWVEIYTDRAAFDARLGKVNVVDFDDIDTSQTDVVSFPADHYLKKHGIVIAGTDGQYAGRTFGYPNDYVPKSKPNSFAPGPVSGKNNGRGGCETLVAFVAGDKTGAVAGFGCMFIDPDYPATGPCALVIRDAAGKELAVEKGFSGKNAEAIFRGMIAVNAEGQPVAVIQSVKLVNGNGWPANGSNEGATLDDFVFSVPVVGKDLAFADRGGSLKARLERRWAFEKKGMWTFAEGESAAINARIRTLGRAQALAELDDAQKAYAERLDVYYYRGMTYLSVGDSKKAIEEFTKLIKLPARTEFDYTARANVFNKVQQFDAALQNVNEAIRLNPKYATAYNDRSVIYSEVKKDTAKAIADLDKAIELAPNHPMFYYSRGVNYGDLKQNDKALADYAKAIELWPDLASAYYNRCLIYAQRGDLRLAIADCDQTIRIDPLRTQAFVQRGLCWADLGDHAAALRDLGKAIELEPKNPVGYEQRARYYDAVGQNARAAADRRKAAELRGTTNQAKGKNEK